MTSTDSERLEEEMSEEIEHTESHIDDSLVMVDNVCYIGFLEEEEQDLGQTEAGTSTIQVLMTSTDSERLEEEISTQDGHTESEDETLVMVDNVCYVGFDDVEKIHCHKDDHRVPGHHKVQTHGNCSDTNE
ncbi:uncharacterized protein LOC125381488 isoform X1 [Haliotis rufescens]|uniref:uncharacterized protein LOC125381488 isoform X1 n=1 Tax=Haliotis rufescens TaxID=6454 RepID=UPI00201FAE9E|nr:uncharacterized protein LOC125381488 isoform X1 [Haliotis rufescens]